MSQLDLRSALEQTVPANVWPMVEMIRATAVAHKMPLYLVGGLVRDLLLEKTPADLDVIVVGDAIQIANQMKRSFGGGVVAHRAFGTAVWTVDAAVWQAVYKEAAFANLLELPIVRSIDFVTARQETYASPAVLPTVKPSQIEADIARRDFTINTLAIRLDGDDWGYLIDLFGGADDLKGGVLRVLHQLSFVDDPTRMLRVGRFATRLNLQMDEQTATLFEEAKPYLRQTTGVRLWHELALSFLEPEPTAVLDWLAKRNLLDYLVPGLEWWPETAEHFKKASKLKLGKDEMSLVYLSIWLLGLPEGVETAVVEWFMLAKKTYRQIQEMRTAYNGLLSLPDEAKPSQTVAYLNKLPSWGLQALRCLFDQQIQSNWIAKYESEWQYVSPTIDGDTLIQMGLSPGPQFKEILDTVQAAWLDGEIKDPLEEHEAIKKIVSSYTNT